MLVTAVRTEMVEALKAGDKNKKNVLSLLVSALDKAAKEKKSELSEQEEGQIVLKMCKQIQETIDTCPVERTDILDKAKNELSITSKFAPKQMNEAEIKEVIQNVLSELKIEAPTGKDKEQIMKLLMPRVKGKADGKLVNSLLAEYMK